MAESRLSEFNNSDGLNDCFWPKADIENTEIQRTFDYLQIHEIEGRFRPKVL